MNRNPRLRSVLDDLERRPPRPDHGQIAIEDGQQPVQVHRAVRETDPNHLRHADLAQHALDLVGPFLVRAQSLGEKAEILVDPDDVRTLEGP